FPTLRSSVLEVGLFHYSDSSICTESVVQLICTDIDCVDMYCPIFQGTVGEPACGTADISDDASFNIQVEGFQCPFKFYTAPGNEGTDIFETDICFPWINDFCRFVDRSIIIEHFSRHDDPSYILQ